MAAGVTNRREFVMSNLAAAVAAVCAGPVRCYRNTGQMVMTPDVCKLPPEHFNCRSTLAPVTSYDWHAGEDGRWLQSGPVLSADINTLRPGTEFYCVVTNAE